MNDFSNLIWEEAQSSTMHAPTGLESGAEYVFAITAGHGAEDGVRWSAWSALARRTPE